MPDIPFDMDIAVQCEDWRGAFSDVEGVIKMAVSHIFETLDTPKEGELSIALVDDAAIQALNRDYRGKDKPTNVLSFPDEGPAPLLGDIVLALETTSREAHERTVPLRNHVTHLIMHGFLHLQGYDHETYETAAEMEALEIKALRALNIDNPYEINDE